MNYFQKTNTKLEKLRTSFFLTGLIIAGGLTLVAFEWTFPEYNSELEGVVIAEAEGDFEYVKPFEIEKEVQEIKELAPPKVKSDQIEIVKNDEVIKEIEITKEEAPLTINEGEWESTEPTPIEPKGPFIIVEQMPEFIGGESALFKFLRKKTKYPKTAVKAGIQGTVYLKFVVGKTGKIKNIEILRGVNDLLDKEAIRVVKSMPNWKPGKQRGKPVEVEYNLPISFKLK